MARVSDISGELIPSGSGATVWISFHNGKTSDVELHLTDQEVGALLDQQLPRRPGKSSGRRLDQIRKEHARAYERWESDEDERLRSLFHENQTVPQIARLLQRQPGGIRSRLLRLGLITK